MEICRDISWPGMGKSAKEFVNSYESCQRSKSGKLKVGLLQPLPIPESPWDSISMDFIVGLPRTDRNHDAIFTFVDRLSKYVHLVPTTTSIDAQGAARLYVDHVFASHNLSKTIVSDRDPRYMSTFFKEVFSVLGVKLQFNTANHPQTDGMTERINRVVDTAYARSSITSSLTGMSYSRSASLQSILNSDQTSTGESPFFLNTGQHPLTPSSLVDACTSHDLAGERSGQWLIAREEALKIARDAMVAAQARQAFYADRGRKSLELQVGDQVMVHREFLVTPEARNCPCDRQAAPSLVWPI